MPNFDNIPKVKTTITDGNLRIVPEPTTPKVTLLGTTNNTTISLLEPTRVVGSVRVSDFDLNSGKPSELSRAIQECQDAGADNIEVMIISRTTGANDGGALTADARWAALDTAYALLLDHPTDIVVPVGAYIDAALSSSNSYGYQLANYCFQATKSFDATIGVIATTKPVDHTTDDGLASISLTAMSNWVTNLAAFNTATGQGANFTIFDGVTDANTDGVPDNYGFWATTDEAIPSGSPRASDADVVDDQNGNPTDLGPYISVVAGLYRFRNQVATKQDPANKAYDSTGEAAYAGLIAGLAPHIPPTNKIISGPSVIRNLSLSQADTLCGKRFVVFRDKAGVTKVVNGMTGAYNISSTFRSDFVRLSTVRIVHDAIDRVRAVADPFIGQPNNGVNIQALRAEIDQTLGRLQELGALRRYEFKIVATPAMQVLGQVTVNITLVPAFEITEITQNIALAKE